MSSEKTSMNGVSESESTIQEFVKSEYKYGFYTDVETDAAPPGLNEDIIRLISAKKKEPAFMLEWRLKAYRHWLTMKEPTWPHVHYPPIDYQKIIYYSAPKKRGEGPKSLDEVDPKLLETYEKLGIPLRERERLAGVAVDAVFDSVSVGNDLPRGAGREGDHFLFVFRGGAEASGAGPEAPRVGRAAQRQLFCGLERGRVHRRLLLLHPQGSPLPDGTVDLFPDQRAQHRPVRADADCG